MFRFIEIRGVGVRESMYFMPVVKTRYGCDSMTAILRDKFLKRVYCICVYYVTYFSSHFTFDTHRIHKKIFFPVGLLAHMVCTLYISFFYIILLYFTSSICFCTRTGVTILSCTRSISSSSSSTSFFSRALFAHRKIDFMSV